MASTGYADVRVGWIPRTMRPRALLLDSIEQTELGRFELGIKFQPRSCTPLTIDDPVWCATETLGAPATCEPYVEQFPFHLIDGLTDSTLGLTGVELEDLLTTREREMKSWAFARTLIGSSTYAGLTLANQAHAPDGGYTAGVSFLKGLQILENELADNLHNAAGLIHVSPGLLAAATAGGGLVVADSEVYTVSGHRVIGDAGYFKAAPPTGQAASTPNTSEWIYASGPVQYDLSEEDPLDDPSFNSYTDIGTNTVTRFEQSWGIMIFDPCAVTAVLVNY